MWDAVRFRELVSGRRTSGTATVLRGLLRLAECPYAGAVAARNRAYDLGWKAVERVDVPVVSIGNLTTGGTGKTPLAAWLVRWARAAGLRVVLISRGYHARPGEANDEARELAERFPDLVHLQQPDRVSAARRAVAEFGAQLILLDDGFQHRRLRRDLDIVLLDALEPFGFDHLLPRGLLRESLAGLRRAHVVGLSRADLVSETARRDIKARVALLAPQATWLELSHAFTTLRSSDGAERSWRELAGRPVAAFAGIGNPEGFRRALVEHGYLLSGWREFPDHHHYASADLDDLTRWAAALQPRPVALVCTHKDLVKIPRERLGDIPLEAVCVETRLQAGEPELVARLRNLDVVHHA